MPPPTPINPFAPPRDKRRLLPQVHFSKFRQARFSPPAGLTHDELLLRQKQGKDLAKKFCKATLETRFGTDEQKVLDVLRQVHQQGVKPEFEIATLNEARRHGKIFNNASEIIQDEFAGNVFEKIFKNATRKEALDYLALGRNTYQATAGDYRLYGMYRSLADFGAVCKQHPAMSAGIIGAVAYLGAKYPFLGGISGIGIMGWGSAMSVINEVKAARRPQKMDALKARQYMASGENLAAVLITAIGTHGIIEGNQLGKAAIQGVKASKNMNPAHKFLKQASAAITATEKKYPHVIPHDSDSKLKLVKTALFVSGLFDNVLLPFNWAAEKLSANTKNKH